MTAVLSSCRQYRYSLSRNVQFEGLTYAFFGVNPSTADATADDATIRKLIGFTKVLGGGQFLVGNLFAFRSTDVTGLSRVEFPEGYHNLFWLNDIISKADVLVPCWGDRAKLSKALHYQIGTVTELLMTSGKPCRTFGLTKSGDPRHPLMLGYSTPLVNFFNPTNAAVFNQIN